MLVPYPSPLEGRGKVRVINITLRLIRGRIAISYYYTCIFGLKTENRELKTILILRGFRGYFP